MQGDTPLVNPSELLTYDAALEGVLLGLLSPLACTMNRSSIASFRKHKSIVKSFPHGRTFLVARTYVQWSHMFKSSEGRIAFFNLRPTPANDDYGSHR